MKTEIVKAASPANQLQNKPKIVSLGPPEAVLWVIEIDPFNIRS